MIELPTFLGVSVGHSFTLQYPQFFRQTLSTLQLRRVVSSSICLFIHLSSRSAFASCHLPGSDRYCHNSEEYQQLRGMGTNDHESHQLSIMKEKNRKIPEGSRTSARARDEELGSQGKQAVSTV